MPVDLTVVAIQYKEVVSEMQNDAFIRTSVNIKGTIAWLCDATNEIPKFN
jgi:hypothetical protein